MMKNIYISWHFTTHGIAYFKHILSAFYSGKCKISDEPIMATNLSQIEMHEKFNDDIRNGFVFDEILYLTAPQKTFDKISSRRFYYRKSTFEDEQIIKEGTIDIWKKVLELDYIKLEDCLEKELDFVKKEFPDRYKVFYNQIWRDMQHYPIKGQVKWFLDDSNASKFYKEKFELIELNVSDLRDTNEIAKEINNWISKLKLQYPDANYFINVSLGSSETQVAWHVLSELNCLPQHTRFLKTYDNKDDEQNKRFKLFNIQEVPTNLLKNISKDIKIFENTNSPARSLARLKMKAFLKDGFTILILGERGVGKSQLVKDLNKNKSKDIERVNCASFADDTMAESALFGYTKGAFTGASKDTDGHFQNANGKILFLDEVHHLSKRVQAKLMLALETDSNNFFNVRKLGSSKEDEIKCTIILASNKKIEEIKDILMPDFYDRIAQLIIEIPPLRETSEDRVEDWKTIWEQMKFGNKETAPSDKNLMNWIIKQPLYGNFRDLQLIAMYYKSYMDFDNETKEQTRFNTAVDYAIAEFEKYHSNEEPMEIFNFSEDKTIQQMEEEYHKEFVEWALKRKNNNLKEVERHFKANGSKIDYRTLSKWKNGK
jgi:transcriptional regulator with AAA-type ATPase domain